MALRAANASLEQWTPNGVLRGKRNISFSRSFRYSGGPTLCASPALNADFFARIPNRNCNDCGVLDAVTAGIRAAIIFRIAQACGAGQACPDALASGLVPQWR